MKFSLLAAFGIFILVGVGAMAAYYLYQNKPPVQLQEQINASPIPTPFLPNRSIQGTSSAFPRVQPQSGTDLQNPNSSEIQIISPSENSKASSPANIKGFASSSDGILLKVKDQNGTLLGEGKASPCINANPCLFEGSVVFTNPPTQIGYLEVSNKYSTKTIPVTF